MASDIETVNTTVWRKGRHEKSQVKTCDGRADEWRGDRRSRQIGCRHWVRKEVSGFCSSGYAWGSQTLKLPGRKEQPLTPVYWDSF